MEKTAHISDCGCYRWSLGRYWADDGPLMVFVMLNPSTADSTEDDPTIRRCIGFAKREKCRGILVVNLFAYRATDPQKMAAAADPVGTLGTARLHAAIVSADDSTIFVAAWGQEKPGLIEQRACEVRGLFKRAGRLLHCLGFTANGSPRHPLYVKSDSPLTLLD